TGVYSMHGVRDESDNLANRHLRIAQLTGGIQQRAKDNLGLMAQHLYVYDGNLQTEERIAGELKANQDENAAAIPQLEKLVAGTPGEHPYDAAPTGGATLKQER